MAAAQPVSFLDALASRYGADDDTASYDPSAFVVGGADDDDNNNDNSGAQKGSRRRRHVKVWEFVGMDDVRAKQRRYDRLQHVQLREAGMTVAVKPAEREHNDNDNNNNNGDGNGEINDALSRAHLVRLQTLDLSANAQLSLGEVGKLLRYLPALDTLQLCDIPTLLQQQQLPSPTATTTTTQPGDCCYYTPCRVHTASALPAAATTTTTTAVLYSAQLTKLVLNNTGFRVCAQLCALVELPQLRELHLDSNELTSFDVYDRCRCCCCDTDNSDDGAACVCECSGHTDDTTTSSPPAAAATAAVLLPRVTTLSLAHNKLSTWALHDDDNNYNKTNVSCGCACARVPRGLARTLCVVFPALTQLYLGHNALPNLTLPATTTTTTTTTTAADALPPTYAFLRQLRVLHVNDNAGIDDTRSVDALRVLCPQLDALRISYETLLPTWNATLARMYVIAALPSLTLLNRGQVRAKERLDADVFYIQRGLAAQQQQQQEQQQQQQARDGNVSYALLSLLREKHKDVVLAIYRDGDTASSTGAAHVMLTVTLQCENHYTTRGSGSGSSSNDAAVAVTRTLPSSLTLGKLKALVRALFGIDHAHQHVRYRTSDTSVLQLPVEMSDELQTLAYYGVGNGDTILVRDTSVRE